MKISQEDLKQIQLLDEDFVNRVDSLIEVLCKFGKYRDHILHLKKLSEKLNKVIVIMEKYKYNLHDIVWIQAGKSYNKESKIFKKIIQDVENLEKSENINLIKDFLKENKSILNWIKKEYYERGEDPYLFWNSHDAMYEEVDIESLIASLDHIERISDTENEEEIKRILAKLTDEEKEKLGLI